MYVREAGGDGRAWDFIYWMNIYGVLTLCHVLYPGCWGCSSETSGQMSSPHGAVGETENELIQSHFSAVTVNAEP